MNSLEEQRKDPDARVQQVAVWADSKANRNLTWARSNPNASVRQEVAHTDTSPAET
jgi:hypothetical protein